MQKIKLIIFDLDGTLVDAYRAVSRSLNFALKKLNLPKIDDQVIQRRVGWGEKILVSAFVPPSKRKAALSIYRRHHPRSLRIGTKFLPGAQKIIRALAKDGYLLAVASNRPTRFTNIILEHLSMKRYFACVLCADKVKNPKPAPDILLGIMKNLACRPHETIYVGDMTIDVQAGKLARVKTVSVLTGSSTRSEIRRTRPSRIIRSLAQLPQIVDGKG